MEAAVAAIPDGYTGGIDATAVEDMVFIGYDLLIPAAEFEQVTGMIVSLYGRIMDLLRPYPDVTTVAPEGGPMLMRKIAAVRTMVANAHQEHERATRLAERAAARPPDPEPQQRLCVIPDCRKPARLNSLCKRHAYAAGLMPHGKIGEG